MMIMGIVLYYIYNDDELLVFVYDHNTYYYHKNIFSDIIGILDSNYNEIVSYAYDSYGNILSIVDNSGIDLGTINPFRFRSYYYDNETGLYYLSSRYYNPVLRRFINADNNISGQGYNGNNLFVYCGNNPIVRFDDGGESWYPLVIGIAGAVIGAAITMYSNQKNGEAWNSGIYGSMITGFVEGVVASTPVGMATLVERAVVVASAAIIGSVVDEVQSSEMDGREIDTQNIVINSTVDVISSSFNVEYPTVRGALPKKPSKILTGKHAQNYYKSTTGGTLRDNRVNNLLPKNNKNNFKSKGKTCRVNVKKSNKPSKSLVVKKNTSSSKTVPKAVQTLLAKGAKKAEFNSVVRSIANRLR